MEIWNVNFSTLNTSTEKCNGWPSKITHTDNLTNGIYKADGMNDHPAFSINAVDIDWNGALMIFNDESVTFNNTGDLLKYIQNLHDEVINNEKTVASSLNELNNRIGLSSGNVDLSDYVNLTTTSPQTIKSNIVLKNGLAILDESDPDDRYLIAKFYSDAGDGIEFHHVTNFYDAVNFNNSNLYLNGYSLIRKEILTGSKNCLVINDYKSDYKTVAIEADDLYIAKKSVESGKDTVNMYKVATTETTDDIYNKLQWVDLDTNPDYVSINDHTVRGIRVNEIIDYNGYNTIISSSDETRIGDNHLNLKLYSLSNPIVNVNNTEQTLLHTGNLSLNYADNQLSLKSGNTTFGNAISLSNIGGVKTFNVTTNSGIDNNIIYNGTSYLLSKFIHDNCTDGLNIIKITPNYSNPYYSELYIIVEYISKIESIYKEFIVTGHLLYNNDNTIAVVNDQDSLSISWLITIDAKGYTSIEKNLGLDSRILPLVEVEQLNYIEGQNMSYGTSAQIKITSNVEGTIKNLYSDNDSSHSYDIIHLSKKLFLIEIKNNNTSSQTNRLSTLKIKFTPTDTENYKEVILDINIKGDNGQFLILNVKQSTVDYVLINADTKKLESLTSNPTYNYVGNNTTAIISLQKCNVSGSDITITPIEIDNYATELMRFIDYDRCEEFSKSEDTDIGTVSINNNTITFKSKAASVQSIYSCGFYKNKVIKIPYTEYSNYVEFSLYPKEFNSSEFVKDIYIYKYENGTLTSIDPDDSNSYLNDMIKYLHLSKGDTVLDYELHFTINENSATDIFNFRNTILFISTEGNINSLDNTTNGIMIHFIQETPSYTRIYYGLGLGYKNTDATSNQGYSTNNQAYLNYLNTKEDWTEGLFSILNSKVINHFDDQLTLYSENFSEKLSSNRLDPKDYYYVAIPDIFFDVYKRPTYPKFNTKSYLWGDQSYTIYRKPVSDNMTEILTKK